jgi:hypothetical protein
MSDDQATPNHEEIAAALEARAEQARANRDFYFQYIRPLRQQPPGPEEYVDRGVMPLPDEAQ